MHNKRRTPEVTPKNNGGKRIHAPNNPEEKIANTISEKGLEELKQELKTLEEEFHSIYPVSVEQWAWDWTQSISVRGLKDGKLILIKEFTWTYSDDIQSEYYKWKEGNDKKLSELKKRMKNLRKEIKKLEISE